VSEWAYVRVCVCARMDTHAHTPTHSHTRTHTHTHTHTHTQETALLQQEMGAVEKLMEEEVDRLQDALQKSQHHLAVS